MAKDYFLSKNISFEDKNVGIDRQAGEEMISKSGQMGVPVVLIDDNVIVGFDPEAFDNLLK
jgi:glutaredoxin